MGNKVTTSNKQPGRPTLWTTGVGNVVRMTTNGQQYYKKCGPPKGEYFYFSLNDLIVECLL